MVAHREMVTIAEDDQPWRFLEAAKGERLERLQTVAATVRSGGPVAAYTRLAHYRDSRLRHLGPDFGTKYLAFCSAEDQPPALILDRLVACTPLSDHVIVPSSSLASPSWTGLAAVRRLTVGGLEDELEGKAKAEEGNLTGDAKERAEGEAQKELGAVEQEAKDKAQGFEKKL
jgi:uncharacterized protein YjbJ (UPF0337 family)